VKEARTLRRLATLLLGSLAMGGCAKTTTARLGLPELRTVPHVDIERYVGTWYEIASFPQRFQRGCTGTTATYTIRSFSGSSRAETLWPGWTAGSPV
jgi:apolipoprotein D and lipocalin family protein